MRLSFFSSSTLKLCLGICWAPKVPEWAPAWPTHRASHPSIPAQATSQSGVANSPKHTPLGGLEQLLQHNVTTAHQQRPHSTPTMLFLCSVLSWLSTSTCSGLNPLQILCTLCSQIIQPPCSSCPYPASPTNPSLASGPLLPTPDLKWPTPSPPPFLPLTISRRISRVRCPFCFCFKGCFPLPLDS